MIGRPLSKKRAFSVLVAGGAALGLVIWLAFGCRTADVDVAADVREIDEELVAAYQEMLDAEFDVRYDSSAPRFKELLLSRLANPVTFEAGALVKLADRVLVTASSDERVKFYSWDEGTGGTWHNIQAVAQFRTGRGMVGVRMISSGTETETGACTDSEIRDVYDVVMGGAVHYLTIGLGTHGGGLQHEIIQIFRIVGDELIKCPDCLDGAADVTIEYPRMESAEMSFDPATNEISYNEFAWDDEAGTWVRTGETAVLTLAGSRFTRKKFWK